MNNAVATETKPTEYNVVDLDAMKDRFAKLVKRAAKLGVPAPGYEVVGSHVEYETSRRVGDAETIYVWAKAKDHASTGRVRVVNHVILTGVRQVKLAGWTFVAVLDYDLGENNVVIRPVPGQGEVAKEFRHSGNLCNHCNTRRRRNATYVCRHDDGRMVQVGSTCLSDYMGHDASKAIAEAELFSMAESACGDFEGGGSGKAENFDLVTYLAWCAKSIRENGWCPRKDADPEFGRFATADTAIGMITAYTKQR